jgi:hypothetical protein
VGEAEQREAGVQALQLLHLLVAAGHRSTAARDAVSSAARTALSFCAAVRRAPSGSVSGARTGCARDVRPSTTRASRKTR